MTEAEEHEIMHDALERISKLWRMDVSSEYRSWYAQMIASTALWKISGEPLMSYKPPRRAAHSYTEVDVEGRIGERDHD